MDGHGNNDDFYDEVSREYNQFAASLTDDQLAGGVKENGEGAKEGGERATDGGKGL